jgi:glycosyltransferase involved in cell wall biosynthesis
MAEVKSQAAASIAVVIPALNEELAIRAVVSAALLHCSNIIVVDDGSSDGTTAQVADLPIRLIRHERPLGKAQGLLDGFDAAIKQGCTGVVTMDGDGQHSADDIPRLLAAAVQYPDHIIIGARLIGRDTQPSERRFGNNVADWFISWVCGQRIVDTQSGQRYYPRVVMELARDLPNSGFVFESEILIEAARRCGIRTAAVPIESRYEEGARASHFKPWRDVSRITRMIAWRLFLGGFMPGNYWRARRQPPIVVDPATVGR